MSGRKVPSPPAPYGGTPARHSGTNNKPIRRVVIHSAVMACEEGAARNLARWNAEGTTGGSWHYATDPGATLQCSWDSYVCHHAPPNAGSLGIEMADYPGPRPKGLVRSALHKARKSWRWARKPHRLMLDRTARLTAGLCYGYGLPPEFVTTRGLRRGQRGWTTHDKVSKAWGQSSHWDPGWWPRRRFGRKVRRYYNEMKERDAR